MANRDDESDLDSDDDLDSDEMSSQAGYLCCTHCPAKFSLMSQLERYPSHIYIYIYILPQSNYYYLFPFLDIVN